MQVLGTHRRHCRASCATFTSLKIPLAPIPASNFLSTLSTLLPLCTFTPLDRDKLQSRTSCLENETARNVRSSQRCLVHSDLTVTAPSIIRRTHLCCAFPRSCATRSTVMSSSVMKSCYGGQSSPIIAILCTGAEATAEGMWRRLPGTKKITIKALNLCCILATKPIEKPRYCFSDSTRSQVTWGSY